MAKSAKARVAEVTPKVLKNIRAIHECYEEIDSARGKFLNASRSKRERMTSLYEAMAMEGIPQKSAKLIVKIDRALRRIEGWQADLEAEDRKIAQKIAKARGDKKQLAFWTDMPKAKKDKAEAPKLELIAAE